MIDRICSGKSTESMANHLALERELFAVSAHNPAIHSMLVEVFQIRFQMIEDELRILQEKKLIPNDVDPQGTALGIAALMGMVKYRFFLAMMKMR